MNIEMKIKEILEQLDGLPQKDRVAVIEFLEHSEWGVAIEHLCATIFEENIPLSDNVIQLIKGLSLQMGICVDIREQIKDII